MTRFAPESTGKNLPICSMHLVRYIGSASNRLAGMEACGPRSDCSVRFGGSNWIISELYSACNRPASSATKTAVKEWLQNNQDGI